MDEKKDFDTGEKRSVQTDSEASSENGEGRGKWGGQIEFLLSCIGYCVGLGNVWRFPYLTYENGGGAFLIPYLIMLFLCGIPLFMMELSYGQFAGIGPVTAWRSVPILKGIGYGMMIVSFLVCIYYNVIIAWSLFYLFASFQSVLPWTLCDQWWNIESRCETNAPLNGTNSSITAMYTTTMQMTSMSPYNVTNTIANSARSASTSEEYWKNRVLRINLSTGIDDPGNPLWDLSLCLLLAWIIVYFCLIKGVKSTGKVVYFSATFPYVVLIILLIRGCTLEGAGEGIRYYVTPDWDKLSDSKVWSAAATQIFYSLGVSFGGLLTFASYNKFNHNIVRDTLIVTIGNCATSIFAGFVIFSIIGHMAFRQNIAVDKVVDQGIGPGLAFIAYPEAVSLLPVPQLWSVLFFFMLLTLGLDSQFAMLETFIAGLSDEFPRYLRNHKMLFTLALATVAFLLGLLLVTEGGMYWFNLYDSYSAYYGLLVLSLMMCLAINWGYGFFFTYRWRFNKDIKLMLGSEPNIYFKAAWMVVTPAMLVFLIVFSSIGYSRLTYGDYVYPKWADNLGLCMSVSCAAVVPIYAAGRCIYAYFKGEPLLDLLKPDKRWGPSDSSIDYDSLEGVREPPAYSVYQQNVTDDVIDPFSNTNSSRM